VIAVIYLEKATFNYQQTDKKGGAKATTIAENEIYENVYKTTQPYAGEQKIST
jgi:hypothetical protein